MNMHRLSFVCTLNLNESESWILFAYGEVKEEKKWRELEFVTVKKEAHIWWNIMKAMQRAGVGAEMTTQCDVVRMKTSEEDRGPS